MRPVMQTRFGWPDGNCTEACIASMLGCGIEDVPDLKERCNRVEGKTGAPVLPVLNAWLKGRGLSVLWVDLQSVHSAGQILSLHGEFVHLMSGPSPRCDDGSFEHMVVAVNGRMIHDPYPGGEGISGRATGHGYLVKLFEPGSGGRSDSGRSL